MKSTKARPATIQDRLEIAANRIAHSVFNQIQEELDSLQLLAEDKIETLLNTTIGSLKTVKQNRRRVVGPRNRKV